MFKLYYFKKPMNKSDVKGVLLNGLIAAIISGLVGGAIDFLFYKINFSLELGMFIICFAVGFRMKRGYKEYHILYPTLTFLFMLLGLLFDGLMYYMLYYMDFGSFFSYISTFEFYLQSLFSPIMQLIEVIKDYSLYKLVLALVNVVIYFVVFQSCYKFVKGTL